jgi:hypothetical protein
MKTMKKTILILLVAVSLFSCSKNDDDNGGEQQLALNYENMSGDWDYTTVIKADGSEIPYLHRCSINKDFAHIESNATIKSRYYNQICEMQENNCDGYYFNGNRIINCFDDFSNARVTSLTATTMKLEYDEDKSFGSIAVVARGVILKKR